MYKKDLLKQKIEQDIADFLKTELPSVELIIIFGSFITDNYDPQNSDIDIAVLAGESLGNIQRWNIQEKLASRLSQDIDLVNLRTCNDVLKFEIVHTWPDHFSNRLVGNRIVSGLCLYQLPATQ